MASLQGHGINPRILEWEDPDKSDQTCLSETGREGDLVGMGQVKKMGGTLCDPISRPNLLTSIE